MTGLGMRIGEECWQEGHQVGWDEGRQSGWDAGRQSGWDAGHQSGVEAGEEREKRNVAFRLFERNQSLEDVSSIIDRPMEYTLELRQEYERKVHEKSKYGE